MRTFERSSKSWRINLVRASTRAARLTAWLFVSWSVMVLTHELGHIVCGWAVGARLVSADLAPWRLPYSIFDPDPYPLVTLWGGPVCGVLVPLTLAALVRRPLSWFIAYFCILANGTYLALAGLSGGRMLDTQQLLDHGTPPVVIGIYCLSTIMVGYLGLRRQTVRIFFRGEESSRAAV